MIPEPLTRYVVPQGSITIEGISLTVASINGNEVEIAIIPTPTPLPASTPWPPVPHSTFQVDVLGKYAEGEQQKQEKFIFTEQYLIANGY